MHNLKEANHECNLSEKNSSYHTKFQELWESRSSVRTRPRKIFDFSLAGFLFPEEKQPLLSEKRVLELGSNVKDKILLYSFCKHLYDITDLEIKLINTTCYNILFDSLVVKFPPTLKLNTLLVMVDEYYHVYVANDLKMQLEKHYPELKAQFYPSSDAYTALTEVRNQLEEKYQDVFQLIAVSIFETTLVKELTDLFNAKNIHCSIREYINGHINDEAKHHNFFFDLLCFTWQNLDKDFQDVIGGKLVDFLLRYFGVASWREFNYRLLLKLTNDPILSEEIIKDLFDNFEVTPEIPIVRNVIKTLTKAGISDNEFFKKSLTAIGWEL